MSPKSDVVKRHFKRLVILGWGGGLELRTVHELMLPDVMKHTLLADHCDLPADEECKAVRLRVVRKGVALAGVKGEDLGKLGADQVLELQSEK